MKVDAFLAKRVHDLRKSRGLTLEQLADLSGVSRSMISLIERQETSPTAAVLNRLADAFGISLPSFFAAGAQPAGNPVSRTAEQLVWTDPASGYVRRHLSPTGVESPVELVEVTFPPGETVVFENPLRKAWVQQQLWMVEGSMDVTSGDSTWRLDRGDCIAMALAARITFHNPHPTAARYLLALTSAPIFPGGFNDN